MSAAGEMICPPPGNPAPDVGHQVGDGGLRVLDGVDGGGGHLAQVVGRDLGGHAHRNAGGAVEQHEGQAGGQELGLFKGAVVVGAEIHRAPVDLGAAARRWA